MQFCSWDYRCRFAHHKSRFAPGITGAVLYMRFGLPFYTSQVPFALGITSAVLHICLDFRVAILHIRSTDLHLGLPVCRFAHYMNLAAVLHTVAVSVAVLQVWGYRCRLALGYTGAVLHMCLGFPFCILEVPFCTWDYKCRFAHVCLGLPFCTSQFPFALWITGACLHMCLGFSFCTWDYMAVLHM